LSLTQVTTQQALSELSGISAGFLFGLARFERSPTESERRELEERGLKIIWPVQGQAYRVGLESGKDPMDPELSPRVLALAMIQPQDRVTPEIWAGDFRRFARLTTDGREINYVQNPDGALNLLVRFYPGSMPSEQEDLLLPFVLESEDLGEDYWAVTAPGQSIRALAEENSVWWISPPPGPGNFHLDQLRDVMGVASIQTFQDGTAYGPSGKGVQVGVFDMGVDDLHEDFYNLPLGSPPSSRIQLDEAASHWHGTHLAGVIAGNGYASDKHDSWNLPNWMPGSPIPWRWRGIAPEAGLIDAEWLRRCPVPQEENQPCPAPEFNFTQLLSRVARYIRTENMDVSNHSYSLSIDGDYSAETQLHDRIIRGTGAFIGVLTDLDWTYVTREIPPRLHVYSAGNAGYWSQGVPGHQLGFFSLDNQTKNGLVVGSYYSAGKRLLKNSSRGPTYDGRIKPDVLAPGFRIRSAMYCDANSNPPVTADPNSPGFCDPPVNSSLTAPRWNFYAERDGSSISAAAVSGLLSLVLETYASAYGVDLDISPPLPSTLRAIVIHTAKDQISVGNSDFPDDYYFIPEPETPPRFTEVLEVYGFEGPDFATGWGLADAGAAVRIVEEKKILEGTIGETCQVRSFPFHSPGVAPVKVTLTWDDFPGDVAESDTVSKLQNDLDLVLVDPNGSRHLPWQLNHAEFRDVVTGILLDDDQQTCGRPIRVVRDLTPTLHPESESDPIVQGQLIQAQKGKDHLNNVEQVVAPRAKGNWIVEVSGYNVMHGPQPFSLIGVPPFATWVITPTGRCDVFPHFCESEVYSALCARFPEFCDQPFEILVDLDGLRGSFSDQLDRWILPVNELCFRLGGVCAREEPEDPFNLILGGGEHPFRVDLYDSGGALLFRDHSRDEVKRIPVTPRPGSGQLLVVGPLDPFLDPIEVVLPVSVEFPPR
ncbi:S8 family serine peptidase, partial [Gemmatimonadota bacterium]